jgi:hypothetical protein
MLLSGIMLINNNFHYCHLRGDFFPMILSYHLVVRTKIMYVFLATRYLIHFF